MRVRSWLPAQVDPLGLAAILIVPYDHRTAAYAAAVIAELAVNDVFDAIVDGRAVADRTNPMFSSSAMVARSWYGVVAADPNRR